MLNNLGLNHVGRNRVGFTLLLTALTATMLTACSVETKSFSPSSSKNRAITVSGESVMRVTPDQARMQLTVSTQGMEPQNVQNENTGHMQAVKAALISLGLAAEDIETVSYRMQPRTEWNNETRTSDFVGWELQHSIQVTTNNLDTVGEILLAAVNAGVNQVDRVDFDLSEGTRQSVRDGLLAQAALDAKHKATLLASTLSVQLGEVRYMSDTQPVTTFAKTSALYDTEALRAAAPPPVMPGEVTVSAQVSVEFAIH